MSAVVVVAALAGAAVALALPPTAAGRLERARLWPARGRPLSARPVARGKDRRAWGDEEVPPWLAVELLAAVVEAGTAPSRAAAVVADACAACGSPGTAAALRGHLLAPASAIGTLEGAPSPPRDAALFTEVAELLRLAERTGAAPSHLVRQAAADAVRAASASRALAVARLPVRLVLPAGLCVLPAVMLLSVAPVVLDLFGGLLR